jgi:hypothetical protein
MSQNFPRIAVALAWLLAILFGRVIGLGMLVRW